MIEHHALLYEDLRDPVALLRGEGGTSRLAAYWPYAGAAGDTAFPAESVADYSALMAASQSLIAEDILDAYPMHRHRLLMDVGAARGPSSARSCGRRPASPSGCSTCRR